MSTDAVKEAAIFKQKLIESSDAAKKSSAEKEYACDQVSRLVFFVKLHSRSASCRAKPRFRKNYLQDNTNALVCARV